MKKVTHVWYVLFLSLVLLACSKDDGPEPEVVSLEQVIYFGESNYLRLPSSIASNDNDYLEIVRNSLEYLRGDLVLYSSRFSFGSTDILADTALFKIDSLVSHSSFEVKSTIREGRSIQIGRLNDREYFWNAGLFFTQMGTQRSDLSSGSYRYDDGDFAYFMDWTTSSERIAIDNRNYSDGQVFVLELNQKDGSGTINYPSHWYEPMNMRVALFVEWNSNGAGNWVISDKDTNETLETGSW